MRPHFRDGLLMQKLTIQYRHGFTLLEMAVVIVIIGLVAGGIFTAQNMIRAAELRAIVSEQDRFVKATQEFLDKYQGLPGDLSNAASMWGADTPCPNSTYLATVPITTETCSGDGDGQIGYFTDDLAEVSVDTLEVWRAWQHLSLAGLMDGRFTGRPGQTAQHRAAVGLNVPASKFKPAGWTLLYYLHTGSFAGLPEDHYGHVLLFGGDRGAYDGKYTTEPVLRVGDTKDLDTKIDDGLPRTGKVRAWVNYWYPSTIPGPSPAATASYCVNGATNTYYLPNPNMTYVCSLVFVLGF